MFFLGLWALALFLVTSCTDKEEDTSGVQPTFSSLYSNFFATCASSGCHVEGSDVYDNKINLDLSGGKDAAYDALTSNTIVYLASPDCDGARIVNTAGYDESLIKALSGDDAERDEFESVKPDCRPARFSNMPISVSANVKAALKEWIQRGAPND
jgi:hypothetical protein